MPRTVKGPHLITTSPTLTECHRCHAPVLAATVDGLDRHIDYTALTPTGELFVLMSAPRRRTYTLAADKLIVRTPALIESTRMDNRPVLADHRCGLPTPAVLTDMMGNAVTLIIVALGGVIVRRSDDGPAPF